MAREKNQRDKSPLTAEERLWLERELDLPPFLKAANSKSTKNIVATQKYVEKKGKKSNLLFFSIVLIDLILAYVLISPMIDVGSDNKKVIPTAIITVIPPGGFGESPTVPLVTVTESPTATATPTSTATPSPSASPTQVKKAKSNLQTFAPHNFTSQSDGQQLIFSWKLAANVKRVVGVELSVKKAGTKLWIVISSQTPEQSSVTVDLVSLSSSSEYRIGSVLDDGSIVFSKTLLKLAGVMD
jgi:hypothetical protein